MKCDICKNVTINEKRREKGNDGLGLVGAYGFVHSAWYPKLYPRGVTCHSLIKNKPDHFLILYSVSGAIGLGNDYKQTNKNFSK